MPITIRTAGVLQLPLEHLAGRRPRQLVDELDVARDLVAGEVGLDVVLDLLLAHSRPSSRHGLQPLAELLVVDAEHGHVGDVSWPASRSSTSAGKTFSPPETIMSSSRPSMNRRPVVVEVADVAGGQQPVDLVLVAAAGVALELDVVADEDPARLAARRRACRPRRRASRRCRAAGCPTVPGRLAQVLAAWRSSPTPPRSSRRGCRGARRSGPSSGRRPCRGRAEPETGTARTFERS